MRKPSVCIDANIIINALIAGPFSAQAIAHLQHWDQANIRLMVPMLCDYEVVSALRRAVHLKQISGTAGEDAYRRYLRIPLSRQHNARLLNLSWEMANLYDRSRIYDSSYLAVAHLYGCELWTADKRLYNAVQTKLSWVRWIEDANPLP